MLILSCVAACFPKPPVPEREIHYSLPADIQGFDPALTQDQYSHTAQSQVYQGLLQYAYLDRPYRLEPLLAESLPAVSADGRTYTFKIRPGVRFHDDPAFGGKRRELRASDFVFSLKRLTKPGAQSPHTAVLEGKIESMDAPDDRTLVLKLTRPWRQFPFFLARPAAYVLPREVVERYGEDLLNHAVGTGPFVLKEWRRGQKIVFEKNPAYWGEKYPSSGEAGDRERGLLASAGKPLPFVDRATVWIHTESQPAWLNFLKGNLDFSGIPKDAFDAAVDAKSGLREEYRSKGIVASPVPQVDLLFLAFNLKDPVFGKNPDLRRAISCAVDRSEKIRIFYNQRAVEAQGPIPPGLFGYDPDLKNPYGFDPMRARAFLEAAKKKGPVPLIHIDTVSSTDSRQLSESLVHDLSRIGIRAELRVSSWPQFQESLRKGNAEFFLYAWSADYPDPENFLQLLYSKNRPPGPNVSRFENAEYDRLYVEMRDLEDGPERARAVGRMVRRVQEEVPWVLFLHRLAYPARHAWVKNYKRNEFTPGLFKYLDVDPEEKRRMLEKLK